jgi:hypothetical protein
LTHAPLHTACRPVPEHTQAPLEQAAPVAQVVEQAPQWLVSDWRLKHVPLQFVSPEPLGQTHCRPEQWVPGGHWLPHVLQLAESVAVSVHAPLQTCGAVPVLQTQWPLVQLSPVGHLVPHAPQFDVSDWVYAQ